MKKCMSVLLALVLALALAVPAFAEQTFSGNGSGQVGITADYTAGSDNTGSVGKVYALTLSWKQTGDLAYNGGKTTYSWNYGKLAYDSTTADKGWTGSAAVTITAKNRSNAAMEVKCDEPEPISGLTISGSYQGGKTVLNLGTAATGGFTAGGSEQSDFTTFSIAPGGVSGDTYKGGNIGTITVTVVGK